MNTDIITAPRIKWVSYGPHYWAGYLSGEDLANHSYSIRRKWHNGNLIYRLSGPMFEKLIDCWDLENAKAFAERVEANK